MLKQLGTSVLRRVRPPRPSRRARAASETLDRLAKHTRQIEKQKTQNNNRTVTFRLRPQADFIRK